MERQHIPFDQVHDIAAFRLIVDSVQQCYEVLGAIHALWKPVRKVQGFYSDAKGEQLSVAAHYRDGPSRRGLNFRSEPTICTLLQNMALRRIGGQGRAYRGQR